MHVILDNYAAHKHPKVRQWLHRHPRFTFHFTPTSCSWLNAVEGFFAKLAKRRLKRGVFRCVVDLHHRPGAPARSVAEDKGDSLQRSGPFARWTARSKIHITRRCQERAPGVGFDPDRGRGARQHRFPIR